MPLKLETCSDADMDRAFAIVSAAFGREHPYQNNISPEDDTESGRKTGAERMLATKKSDPNTTFIEVVDTETHKMRRSTRGICSEATLPHAERLSRIQEASYSVSRLCTLSVTWWRDHSSNESSLQMESNGSYDRRTYDRKESAICEPIIDLSERRNHNENQTIPSFETFLFHC